MILSSRVARWSPCRCHYSPHHGWRLHTPQLGMATFRTPEGPIGAATTSLSELVRHVVRPFALLDYAHAVEVGAGAVLRMGVAGGPEDTH